MSRSVTEWILSHSNLKTLDEITPGGQAFSMYNTGGVEVEVGELLYSLVRTWKPKFILETGTHLGISSAYMAMACQENTIKGTVETYEVIPTLQKTAMALWKSLGVDPRINSLLKPSLKAEVTQPIDFLFLDSEPQFRFDEFVKFWPHVVEHGIIVIHDLHPGLGRSNITQAGMDHWPYGDWEPKLGSMVKSHEVQTIHVPNPRGMVIFQKTKATDENVRLLRE